MSSLKFEIGSIGYNKYKRNDVINNKYSVINRVIHDIYTKYYVFQDIYMIYNAYTANMSEHPFDESVMLFLSSNYINKPHSDIIICNIDNIRDPRNYLPKKDDMSDNDYLKWIYAMNHDAMKAIGFRDILFDPEINGFMGQYMIFYNQSTDGFIKKIKSKLK